MIRFRESPDGSLLAPRRGRPPACPDGFETDPQDPYICLPILETCQYRSWKEPDCQSCGSPRLHCAFVDKNITRKTCIICGAKPNVYFI